MVNKPSIDSEIKLNETMKREYKIEQSNITDTYEKGMNSDETDRDDRQERSKKDTV